MLEFKMLKFPELAELGLVRILRSDLGVRCSYAN